MRALALPLTFLLLAALQPLHRLVAAEVVADWAWFAPLVVILPTVLFARVVVGFETFGFWAPGIAALALCRLGVPEGTALLLAAGGAAVLCSAGLARLPMLSAARTGVALGVGAAVAAVVGARYLELRAVDWPWVAPLALTVERAVTARADQSAAEARRQLQHSLVVAIAAAFVASRDLLRPIEHHPDALWLALAAMAAMGRYTGRRWLEPALAVHPDVAAAARE